jgi:magnesium-transporting ATPase (P-type)
MNIPCDGFIVKGIEVTTDESAMTGETDAIRKASLDQCETFKNATNRIDYEDSLRENRIPSPILLSGTKIMSGEGFFVCIVVGVDSCSGKIRCALA